MSNSLGPQFGLQVSPRRLTEITPGVHAEPHADTTSGIHAVQSHGLFRIEHSPAIPNAFQHMLTDITSGVHAMSHADTTSGIYAAQ